MPFGVRQSHVDRTGRRRIAAFVPLRLGIEPRGFEGLRAGGRRRGAILSHPRKVRERASPLRGTVGVAPRWWIVPPGEEPEYEMAISWHPALAVGHAEIDGQHQ